MEYALKELLQIPIPQKIQFNLRHQCAICNKWGVIGMITYSENLEAGIFVCIKCLKQNFVQTQLPESTEFMQKHQCVHCKRRFDEGVMSFCPRCERVEFVCVPHNEKHHDWVDPFQQYNKEFLK